MVLNGSDSEVSKEMPEPQKRDEGSTPEDERELELNYGVSLSMAMQRTGQMAERARVAFEVNEVEKIVPDGGRFETAKREEWQIVFNQTSQAHMDQLKDGKLNEDAYVEDVGLVVFENGWLLKGLTGWVKSSSAVERIVSLKESRRQWDEGREEEKAEVFLSDSRIEYAVDHGGREMPGFWQFTPADLVGKPELVAAFRDGWDAAQDEGQTD